MNDLITTLAPGGQIQSGRIYAANEDRLTEGTFQQGLTDFAVGFMPSFSLLELLDFIAPSVPAARRFEYKVYDSKQGAVLDGDNSDIRSIGGDFKRVDFEGTTVTGRTDNKGLFYRLDKDQDVGDRMRERIVQMLIDRLVRADINRAIAGLEANDTSTTPTWAPSGASELPEPANPLADIRTAKNAAAAATTRVPNRLLGGPVATAYLFDILESRRNAANLLTLQDVATRVGIERGLTSEVYYVTDRSATAKSKKLDDDFFIFTANPIANTEDPSNIKRFVSPTQNGTDIAVYIEDKPKYIDIIVEHYSLVKVTNTAGIRKITPANA